ncbi:MurR/RpiR family transcriptional regulator [Mesorhizobium sp.]|uniref:MurR/RpiR family transcriptional regulator n=1 Tax=Mesorhizobium sp. TaxID=1871066 RepID=UPI000FD3051C|nr:MurR/RpiR family transcriptional regulator [Mesorhizobium sp.]RVC63546.1 MurR/RpiR family transcriptional regulator [Mesorhizobium sp. M4B.F.Ca.ET.088.02.2.1]RVD74280.1 MurR/RpiR family transcriptional regulator [Mesorhizobium sp. M4A.F.Ca.ET.029.04.2.1]RWF28740.1 MAG: MurR/RpiR family transcriptional regulator [Mesorhizobium sp.]RWL02832.1 MAG: MurR/RpiR family transcriptional regulator [Mesorhizobium sp.]
MADGPLTERLIAGFDAMSEQFQMAARYIIDQPHDVALLSMRDQARLAGVQPATMTRLAKHLGLTGYDQLRAIYADAVRSGDFGFAGKADVQAVAQKRKGDHGLARDILRAQAAEIIRLAESQLDPIVSMARRLASAKSVFCIGLRSSHATAWHLQYILSMIGEKSVMLDAIGGTGSDALARASRNDVLFATSVYPYTRVTVEIAEYAHERRIPVVAITDSEVAPLARIADDVVLVQTKCPSFFHTMTPAFAVVEVLGALIAGQAAEAARESLLRFDAHLADFNTHLKSRTWTRKVLSSSSVSSITKKIDGVPFKASLPNQE